MAESIKVVFDAIDNTHRGVSTVSQGLAKVKAAVFAVVAVATGAVEAMRRMSQAYIDYGEQVAAVSRVTNQSAEESSRLIQVADDLFISYENLSVAMKMAVKEGIEPNIENLAKLSDQYLALAPGIDRANFLLDKFGRNGLEMGKMMEKGGAAIKQMAADIPEGLIFDDDNVRLANEMRVAWDNLGDSAKSFGLTIMNDAAPALVELIGLLNDFIDAEEHGYEAWKGIMDRLDLGVAMQAGMARLLGKSATQLAMGIVPDSGFGFDAKVDIKLHPGNIDDSEVREALTKERFDFIMNFQARFDDFDKTRDELLKKMEETRDEILRIQNEKPWDTEALDELRGDMVNMTGELNQNEAEWKQWQKQTAFSIISTRALAQGVDLGAILKMGEEFGVLDPEVVAQAQAMFDAVSGVETSGLDQAVEDIKYLTSQDGRTIRIYVEQTVTNVEGDNPPPTGMSGAAGQSQWGTFINYGTYIGAGVGGQDGGRDVLAEWR